MSDPGTALPGTGGEPAPPRREGRRRVGLAMLLLSGVLAILAARLLWLRQTLPSPPEVDLDHVEPMVADAIGVARDRVRARPRDPAAWGELGMVLHVHDLHELALASYAQAERLAPENPAWPYLAGSITLDPRQRLDAFRRAFARAGPEPTARIRLAETLLEQGQMDESRSLLEDALRVDPGDARAHLALARIAMARGDPRAAIPHLRLCLDRAGDVAPAWQLLAEAYHRAGDAGRAADARARAASSPPKHFWRDPYLDQVAVRASGTVGIGRRARALHDAGRGPEAVALLEELVRRNPDSAIARAGLGRMLVLVGQFAAAEPHLRQALAIEADQTEVRLYLATAIRQQSRCSEAVVEYRRVIDRQPDHAAALLGLGQCLAELGDREGAAAALASALRYQPDNLPARKSLAAVLLELGRPADALVELEVAARLDPADRDVRSLLERVRREASRR